MEYLLVVLVIAVAIYLIAGRKQKTPDTGVWQSTNSKEENYLNEPIISYSVLVADVKTQRLLEIKSPEDYPHHYGILNGQHFELHWNVINADFISIDSVGYVQAVGKKSFFPLQHTQYTITAKNRNHSAEQEFVVHVFPVPLMEMVFAPLPDLTHSKIELNINPVPIIAKPDITAFPSMQIPSAIEIQKNLRAQKPEVLHLQKELIQPLYQKKEYKSFKIKLFDLMENRVKNNYKLTDIIRTIRKHYG